jgi:Cytochrome P460
MSTRSRIANTVASMIAALLVLALSGCGSSGAVTASINQRAALTGSLPWNPLQWKVITSSIDKQASTMSVLYGNDVAVQYARSHAQQDYPPGSVLSLVSWTQQEDSRWFGGKIPGQVRSVEFVSVTGASCSYENYAGSPLLRTAASDGHAPGSRAAYLLSLRAAVMP